MTDRRPALLFFVFFLSGASALTYQVVWVRQLSVVLGATDYALATVLATFMGGLGLGSAWAAKRADAVARPLRVYARLEGAIAVWAFAVPWLLQGLRWAYGHVGVDVALGWRLLVIVGLSIALLLPATICMGATLPLVSRCVVTSDSKRGFDLGNLYAVNTLGAFAGVVITAFWSIEALGLNLTSRVAIGLNIIAALIAWTLPSGHAVAVSTEQEQPPIRRSVLLMGALAGWLGLAHEVVWNRLLGVVLVTTTYAYATMLGTIIAGIGIGSFLGARLADRVVPERLFGWLQMLIGTSVLAIVPLLGWAARETSLLETHTLPFGQAQAVAMAACAGAILTPSILMGATYPPLARAITEGHRGVGRSVGYLYAANTGAAVLGSLCAGFLLMPGLGALATLRWIALGNLTLGALVLWRASARRRLVVAASAATFAIFLLVSQSLSLRDLYLARLPPGSQIVHLEEGHTSTVMVADHSQPRVRRLWVQSVWVAGTGGTHRMLGHLPMLHSAERRSAVGIAFGTGQSFAMALSHGLERLDCVDLDPGVVAAGGRFFSHENRGILDRPEVHVTIDDGRSFLSRTHRRYDAIVMEPLQPWSTGTSNLYTAELYKDARRAMVRGGAIAQWLPLHDIPPWLSRSVVATFARTFPNTYVYLDGFDLVLIGQGEGNLDRRRFVERLTGQVLRDLAPIGYGDVKSLFTALVLGPDDIARYIGNAPLLTDDRPFMEFVAPRSMSGDHFAANVRAMAAASRTPTSRIDGVEDPGLRNGATARALIRGVLAWNEGDVESSLAAYAEAAESTPCARTVELWRNALVRHAATRPGAERIALYRSHLAVDPEFGGGWLNLGVVLAQTGALDGAREAFQRAASDPAMADRASAGLRMLAQPRTP